MDIYNRHDRFRSSEIYHVYNKSVNNEQIMNAPAHIFRYMETFEYYFYPNRIKLSRYKTLPEKVQSSYDQEKKLLQPLVEIYAYAIMPNHFHFLLKPLQPHGITTFIRKMEDSYAQYFNTSTEREGSVFKNRFKKKLIDTDEVFLHVGRYIHLNPVTAGIIKFEELASSPLTSFRHFMANESSIVNIERTLSYFSSRDEYVTFMKDQEDFQKTLADMKKYYLE